MVVWSASYVDIGRWRMICQYRRLDLHGKIEEERLCQQIGVKDKHKKVTVS